MWLVKCPNVNSEFFFLFSSTIKIWSCITFYHPLLCSIPSICCVLLREFLCPLRPGNKTGSNSFLFLYFCQWVIIDHWEKPARRSTQLLENSFDVPCSKYQCYKFCRWEIEIFALCHFSYFPHAQSWWAWKLNAGYWCYLVLIVKYLPL